MTDFRTVLRLFDRTFNIRDIPGLLEKKRTEFTGLNGSARALFISALFQRLSGGIILITRSNRDASDFYGDLSLFLKENEIFLFPSRETLPYDDEFLLKLEQACNWDRHEIAKLDLELGALYAKGVMKSS